MANIDYGIEGRVALVCGSSAGIGKACAIALAQAGVKVILNGRSESRLAATAAEVAAITGEKADWVVADVSQESGRRTLLEACASPDILVNNAAGPPTGDFRAFDESAWEEALQGSMIAPIMMIRQVLDGMIYRQWGRIINITSSAVKAPLPLLGLSNGARSGLTGFVAGLAREVADKGITINNLLPGQIETDRLVSYLTSVAASRGATVEDVAQEMAAANPMKRFGRPEEMGAFCAFLCSNQAAYVTGQNMLIDGGAFRGI